MNVEPGVTKISSVTEGLINRSRLEEDLEVSWRTIVRYERAGMPFIRLGALRLYDPSKVRDWLLSHGQNTAPRSVGRPMKTRHAA